MGMDAYDHRAENLWREAYKNDPCFSYDDTPLSNKVISFFIKRKANEPEINLTNSCALREEVCYNYEYQVDVSWVDSNLKRVLRNKKKFYGDVDLYKYVVLTDYVKQCKDGGYKRCILSWQEMSILKPKKK